ncbi:MULTISPECIES: sarcosine oxidase subunit gamma [unclassified Paraburkholderia]|uniref:sarcosine oxidase subunit gamma n=1 Tax=unclassified Paraburkholderia TaxID=2615204 RepID=UPI002AAF2606|nr:MULTISPECIES: sarcosine oxidase subunit gamma [unclassified Paraburkholderia]
MLNETREPMPLAECVAAVWLESPFVGADDVMKQHAARPSKAFAMRELPFRDLVNVRGEPGDAAFTRAFAEVVGCRLPLQPNTRSAGADYDVLWLGPDEWLVRSTAAVEAGVLEAKLAEALNADSGAWAAAVDVGSGFTTVELTGTRVRDVLARGCPLDLHPGVFKEGQCAQSFFFKASIVLIPIGADRYEVVVRRSFADYFCRILLDAAAPLMS